MVRLQTSFLALAVVAGSTRAFADNTEYQRRSEIDSNLYGREFVDTQESSFTREDHEDLFTREVSDEFEVREPLGLGLLVKIGAKLGGKLIKKIASSAAKRAASNAANRRIHKRGLEHDEELFERDLDDELLGREYDQLDERDIFGDLEDLD